MAGVESVADHLQGHPRRAEIEEALRVDLGDDDGELALDVDGTGDDLNDDGFPVVEEPVHHQVLRPDFRNHGMEQDQLQELLG